MNLKLLSHLFSLRDLRNAVVAAFVIIGGIGLSLVTIYARHIGNAMLSGIAAGTSLVFVLLILIFVVPPLARNASREASQMNLPFEFTTGGAIILILMIVVGFSAWNTGNNLLFLVLSFLVATMIVGFFAGRISLKKLDVKMRFPETIFAGEATPILLSVSNRKRLFPGFSVVVEVRGSERERSIAAADLKAILPEFLAKRLSRPPTIRKTLDHLVFVPRNQTVESKTEHVFPNRGRFLIKDFELSTRFPFGFFRHRRRLAARETELIVFPDPLPFEDLADETPLDVGKLVANKRGLGQDLLALRDYQPNDDLRSIDWKATARSQSLIVREFAAEDDQRITVILDPRMPNDGSQSVTLREKIAAEQTGKTVVESERFERGVNLTASILNHFAEQSAEVRLVIQDTDTGFGNARSHFYEILKQLAIIEPRFDQIEAPAEPDPHFQRISNEEDDSHRYFVTANDINGVPFELVQRLKIIGF